VGPEKKDSKGQLYDWERKGQEKASTKGRHHEKIWILYMISAVELHHVYKPGGRKGKNRAKQEGRKMIYRPFLGDAPVQDGEKSCTGPTQGRRKYSFTGSN